MEIADLLSPDAVLSHLKVASKKQVLQEMAHKAAALTRLPERRIFETLSEREKLGSTGMGQGIAIPHGRVPGIEKMTGLFAQLDNPVDFARLEALTQSIGLREIARRVAGGCALRASHRTFVGQFTGRLA